MAIRKLDCLPVVSDKEQLLGMVHIHDIVAAFLGEFAETMKFRPDLAFAA